MSKPTVAILGASSDRSKYGNKSVRAHVQAGYDVYPVNPKGGTIEGLTAYRTLDEVPVAHLKRISVYLPPAAVLANMEAIAGKGCDELFLNPGTESAEVIEQARSYNLNAKTECSIVDLGLSPSQFP